MERGRRKSKGGGRRKEGKGVERWKEEGERVKVVEEGRKGRG